MSIIVEKTPLHDVMKAGKRTIEVLDSYGMGCKSCGGASAETVEWAAMIHGIKIEELLEKLNQATSKA